MEEQSMSPNFDALKSKRVSELESLLQLHQERLKDMETEMKEHSQSTSTTTIPISSISSGDHILQQQEHALHTKVKDLESGDYTYNTMTYNIKLLHNLY